MRATASPLPRLGEGPGGEGQDRRVDSLAGRGILAERMLVSAEEHHMNGNAAIARSSSGRASARA